MWFSGVLCLMQCELCELNMAVWSIEQHIISAPFSLRTTLTCAQELKECVIRALLEQKLSQGDIVKIKNLFSVA